MKKITARLFGVCTILSFLTYGAGMGLMEAAQHTDPAPAIIIAAKNSIIAGGILAALLHTLLNLGALTIMQQALQPFGHRLSYLYFSCGVLGTFLLAMGAIFLMLPVVYGEHFLHSASADASSFSSFVLYSAAGNFYCYQLGMAIWGTGGLVLCHLLHRSGLVPGYLPLYGFLGYSIFIAGTIAELFGYPLGVWFSIPGGLFEIALSLWLFIKGFRQLR